MIKIIFILAFLGLGAYLGYSPKFSKRIAEWKKLTILGLGLIAIFLALYPPLAGNFDESRITLINKSPYSEPIALSPKYELTKLNDEYSKIRFFNYFNTKVLIISLNSVTGSKEASTVLNSKI